MKKRLLLLILLITGYSVYAQKKADSLLNVLRYTHTTKDSIGLLQAAGMVYFETQLPENNKIATRLLSHAIMLSERSRDAAARVHSIILLGICNMDNNTPRADSIFNNAITTAARIRDTSDIAFGLSRLAIIKMSQDSTGAIGLLQRSLSLYEAKKDSNGIASVNLQLGTYYSRHGDYKKAVGYKLQALKIFERKPANISLGYLLMGLANDNQVLGNYDLALQYNVEAARVFHEIGAGEFASIVLVNMGTIYEIKKEYGPALKNYSEGLQWFTKENDTRNMAYAMTAMGGIYSEMGQDTKALSLLQQALRLADADKNSTCKAEAYNRLATVYEHIHNYPKMLDALNDRIAIVKMQGDTFSLMTAYKRIADVYALTGNYKQAYQYNNLYLELKDSVFANEKMHQIAEMQSKYETEKKGQKIELLNKDKELMQERLDKKNIVILGFFAAALLAICVVFLLLNRRNLVNENKHNKTLKEQRTKMAIAILSAQEEERQRIAKDMHDSLGAYLSSLKINMEVIQPVVTPEKLPVYRNIITGLNKVTAEMRSIAKNLVSDTLRQYGLEVAVEELIEFINRAGTIKIELQSSLEMQRFSTEVETGAFRIIQELLNNSMKHSQATVIFLNLTVVSDNIVITFTDNGIGFDPSGLSDVNRGLGIKNIEARARILNGSFNVDSRPGHGASFKIEISKAIV